MFDSPHTDCLQRLAAVGVDPADVDVVVGAAARTGATVFPAHFAGRGGASVAEDGAGGFTAQRWADLPDL